MTSNYLEQLASEWYEYRGFFVRRNVPVGSGSKGGYEAELTIVAIHPGDNRVVHIEPSMDAHSWDVREKRFSKKFTLFCGSIQHGKIRKRSILLVCPGINFSKIQRMKPNPPYLSLYFLTDYHRFVFFVITLDKTKLVFSFSGCE